MNDNVIQPDDELNTEVEQQLRDQEWQNTSQDPDGLFNPVTDEEKLEEDNDPPAAPPTYADDLRMPQDQQDADTDMDPGGQYYGGKAEEAGFKPTPESDADAAVEPVDLDHEDRAA